MRPAGRKTVYKIVFVNEGKVYEIYARTVSPSSLIGFVEVEGLLFGERTTVLVDPTEERLRTEFAGVERTLIPMHAVVRIDQVAKRGTAKITALSGGADKGRPLPSPVLMPGKGDSSS
ncbi:MAG TPA: DUF1820 family protein [Candidatus Limnocylindria bacterium]|nr:DUF1820 family protein [Candidatus Limnocylindria bacterium]